MEKEQQNASEGQVKKPAASVKASTKNLSNTTKPRQKRTSKKAVGLGDVVEKITEVTGIKSIIEGLTDDCGCNDRKKKLNAAFPFYNEMTDTQKTEWVELRKLYELKQLDASQRQRVDKLYNEVFNKRVKPSRCGPCYVRRYKALEDVYQLCES